MITDYVYWCSGNQNKHIATHSTTLWVPNMLKYYSSKVKLNLIAEQCTDKTLSDGE